MTRKARNKASNKKQTGNENGSEKRDEYEITCPNCGKAVLNETNRQYIRAFKSQPFFEHIVYTYRCPDCFAEVQYFYEAKLTKTKIDLMDESEETTQ